MWCRSPDIGALLLRCRGPIQLSGRGQRPFAETGAASVRVLIWGNSYPRVGGVETFITNLIEGSRNSDVEFFVVSDGTVALELADPYPIRMIPMTTPLKAAEPAGIVQTIASLKRHIAGLRPDVVHYNLCGPEIFFFERVMNAFPIPFVLTLHNTCFGASESITGIFRRLIGRAFETTAVSHAVRDGARRDLGECAADIRLISNAIPAKPPPPPYPANGRILALGRIVPEKGLDTLVEAFAIVRARHPHARLTIGGAGPDLAMLQARAAELRLDGTVEFPGWISPEAVHEAMASAAIVAFPSRWQEPFGLVALEAAQAARPCVATAVGELPLIVRDGDTGRVVPPDDPAALAEALIALLDDPEGGRAMGERARSWADTQFNFDAMIAAYLQLFAQAAAPRG